MRKWEKEHLLSCLQHTKNIFSFIPRMHIFPLLIHITILPGIIFILQMRKMKLTENK